MSIDFAALPAVLWTIDRQRVRQGKGPLRLDNPKPSEACE